MTQATVTALTVYNGADTEPADVHVIPGAPDSTEVLAQVVAILRDCDESFGYVDDADLIEEMQDAGWAITVEAHGVTFDQPTAPATPTPTRADLARRVTREQAVAYRTEQVEAEAGFTEQNDPDHDHGNEGTLADYVADLHTRLERILSGD